MGIDIVCIIRNKLSESEILDIKPVIDSWKDIEQYVLEHRPKEHHYYEPNNVRSTWDYGALDLESLHKVWEYEESRGQKRIAILIGVNRLYSFYCSIRFNRRTIIISPGTEHKYANLQEPEIAEYIIKLVRMIAHKFGENEIIYCVDSTYPTGLLMEEAVAGISFEALKKLGVEEFGEPAEDINEGIKNLFFIDKSTNPIPELKHWGWLDFKYARNNLTE